MFIYAPCSLQIVKKSASLEMGPLSKNKYSTNMIRRCNWEELSVISYEANGEQLLNCSERPAA
jgi:hypothetical protein